MDKPKGLPHYPKPDYVLSVEKAKAEYSLVWEKMGELVPDLTNEEKRRIVEIVANTCHHCWSNESGCFCWRDE